MTMEEKPNCLLYWSSTACKWLKRLMPKWQPPSQKLYLWIISLLLEMQHSFLWVLFSSPALISLTSTEFSCYACMYACMYVCMYVCIQSIAEMLYCRWSPFIHYMQHFLGVVFSVFAIKCYINVAVVWILQIKYKHKHAYM